MLKFEYRHLYIRIGGYTMEQATLLIDMIKLIERFEPIAVIWQNCRVVKLSFKHKQKRVTIWLLAFVFFLVRLKPIIFCLTVVPIPTAR